MAEKKNQHYVPKAHLRPFTRDRKSIEVYNVRSDTLIKGAPIRGQCARPYYYGKDRVLEDSFTEIEGHYATIVNKAVEDPFLVTNSELILLRVFVLLQAFRSYAYVEKQMELSRRHYEIIVEASKGRLRPAELLRNRDDVVKEAISHFARAVHEIDDLDICLAVNRTKTRFITSDDPAIHTNRFFLQKLKIEGTGLACSGTMLFMPLAPTLAIMIFDPNVYYVPMRMNNFVFVDKPAAVDELNELQFLHAYENIYFRDREDGEFVRTSFKKVAHGRPVAWANLENFKQVDETPKAEVYEAVETLQIEPGESFVTKFHFERVKPSNWTRLLKISIRPHYVDTKSAAGVIRPEHPILNRMRPQQEKATIMRRSGN